MTEEEKELLLKDLSARLRYGVKVNLFGQSKELIGVLNDIISVGYDINDYEDAPIEDVKPYLRPMSSMTEEERNDYIIFRYVKHHEWDGHSTYTEYVEVDEINNYFDWLNAHHFDYRGLIEKGIALEAPKGMYN